MNSSEKLLLLVLFFVPTDQENGLVSERAIFAYINHEKRVGKGIVLSPGSRQSALLLAIIFSYSETLYPSRNSKLNCIGSVPRDVSRFPDNGIPEFVRPYLSLFYLKHLLRNSFFSNWKIISTIYRFSFYKIIVGDDYLT